MKTCRIPKTDSVKKLAEFWDTHDLADFEGQLEEVQGSVFVPVAEGTAVVDLKPEEAAAVKNIAKVTKTECKPLLRKWIVERLRQETGGKTR